MNLPKKNIYIYTNINKIEPINLYIPKKISIK